MDDFIKTYKGLLKDMEIHCDNGDIIPAKGYASQHYSFEGKYGYWNVKYVEGFNYGIIIGFIEER